MSEKSDSKTYLPNSQACFVCGEENEAGLKTRFYFEDGMVKARLRAQTHHCGYRNTVHGGVVAAILDECMGWAAAQAVHRMCLTAELTIRYLERVPDDRELKVETEVTKAHRLMVYVKGTIKDDAGFQFATAEGKFSPMTAEQTLEVDDQLLYRGGELRLFDELQI